MTESDCCFFWFQHMKRKAGVKLPAICILHTGALFDD